MATSLSYRRCLSMKCHFLVRGIRWGRRYCFTESGPLSLCRIYTPSVNTPDLWPLVSRPTKPHTLPGSETKVIPRTCENRSVLSSLPPLRWETSKTIDFGDNRLRRQYPRGYDKCSHLASTGLVRGRDPGGWEIMTVEPLIQGCLFNTSLSV